MCTEIYNNRKTSGDGGLYDAHLAESQAFAKFSKKLDDYEMRSHRQNPQDPFDEYPFDELLRKYIYGNSSLNDCPTNETDIHFLNCARDNHILKDQLVPIVSPK